MANRTASQFSSYCNAVCCRPALVLDETKQCYVTNSNVNKHRGIATTARLGMLTITVPTDLF